MKEEDIIAAVERHYQPIIEAEVARLIEIGEEARRRAINEALNGAALPTVKHDGNSVERETSKRKGGPWAGTTAAERSATIKARWPKRRANAAAKAAKPKGARAGRAEYDFYRTPRDATDAFLAVEGSRLAEFGIVCEPACGDGAMARVLEEAGLMVEASDLIDRGFGEHGRNFLDSQTNARAIVTNPPFSLAREFIRHALAGLRVEYLALLLPATVFQSREGAKLFADHPPSVLYQMSFKPKFRDNGNYMTFAWIVWDIRRPGERRVQTIGRAEPVQQIEVVGDFEVLAG